MKKTVTIVVIALIIVTLVILAVCLIPRDRRYDEAEVKEAATSLMQAAAKLNEIYYGEGILYLESSQHNVSIYKEADPDSLNGYGIKTISELKQKTLEVFSEEHAEGMFKSAFSGSFSTQNGTSNLSRYYQKYDDKGLNAICIMVNSSYEPIMNGINVYDLDSIKVIGSKGEYVYFTMDVKVISGNNTQVHNIRVRLIEEDDGWRIASTAFANYNELQDIYNELQKG